jgi:hypothetical protein
VAADGSASDAAGLSPPRRPAHGTAGGAGVYSCKRRGGLSAGATIADETSVDGAEPATNDAYDRAAKDTEKLTATEKKAAEDRSIAALVDEYNQGVEADLDEVVCERIRVTGTRRKVQVCKTKREVLAEQESAKRMLLQRNKAGSDPAHSSGVGSN